MALSSEGRRQNRLQVSKHEMGNRHSGPPRIGWLRTGITESEHERIRRSLQRGGARGQFEIPSLDGMSVSIDHYKGKVILVNFWATWCAPCRTEIPWLIEFNQKYGL